MYLELRKGKKTTPNMGRCNEMVKQLSIPSHGCIFLLSEQKCGECFPLCHFLLSKTFIQCSFCHVKRCFNTNSISIPQFCLTKHKEDTGHDPFYTFLLISNWTEVIQVNKIVMYMYVLFCFAFYNYNLVLNIRFFKRNHWKVELWKMYLIYLECSKWHCG